MNKFWTPISVLIVIIGFFLFASYQEFKVKNDNPGEISETPETIETQEEKKVEAVLATPEKEEVAVPENKVSNKNPLDMPFVVQAPSGEWSDMRFQNGCEEASILMVGSWLQGKTIQDPRKEMLAIMAFEEKKFGEANDTSATDTNTVLREYYGISHSQVVTLETKADLQVLIEKSNVVIAPSDGRVIANPFFVAPGPVNHMLVILDYDAKTKEYIVNDPGTKRGAKYRYKEQILFDAIADYVSGSEHKERKNIIKNVIVVPFT